MKKLLFMFLLLLISNGSASAQVTVNVSIQNSPNWEAAHQNDIRYYYLPEIEAYYDLQASVYIYLNDGKWIRESRLPYAYRNFDYDNGYKVVVGNYYGSKPYVYFPNHRVKYPKKNKNQVICFQDVPQNYRRDYTGRRNYKYNKNHRKQYYDYRDDRD